MINKNSNLFLSGDLMHPLRERNTAVHFSTLEIKRMDMDVTYTFFRDKYCLN